MLEQCAPMPLWKLEFRVRESAKKLAGRLLY